MKLHPRRRPLDATMAPPCLWTRSYLTFVLPLTAEDVLRAEGQHNGATPDSRREWTWIQTDQRLTWLYGPEGALRRLNGYGAFAL